MDIEIGRGKTARRAYGLDEIAIVPSRRTRDPEDVDISWSLGDLHLDLPCLASALDAAAGPAPAAWTLPWPLAALHPALPCRAWARDAAVDPATAGLIGDLGGLAVLNLE